MSTPASARQRGLLVAGVAVLASACESSDEGRPDAAAVVASVFRPSRQDPPDPPTVVPREQEAALERRRDEVSRAAAMAARTGGLTDMRSMWERAFEAGKQGEFETAAEADARRR